jgi:coenzyme F420-dependent glucose-6-phosphate dehydrogenase
MLELGYKLSSEEFGPCDLVRQATRAEQAGFSFALISDHFHPWTDRKGQSPFVWSVLGAVAQATSRMAVGTAVTCPTIRVHPAIVAQAAATTAALMGDRFFLGLGTGENLNEHVVGRGWPAPDVRLAMLEEAVRVIRQLWQGGPQSFHGKFYTVEDARLYTLPAKPPAVMIGASKSGSAELAARLGDAMINTEVDADLVQTFADAGGHGKPRFMEMTVCWAEDERRARATAHEVWGLAALGDMLFTELPTPTLFEAALKPITEETVAEHVVCGPDAQRLLAKLRAAEAAGLHARLPASGRAGTGGLPRVLRAGDPAGDGQAACDSRVEGARQPQQASARHARPHGRSPHARRRPALTFAVCGPAQAGTRRRP